LSARARSILILLAALAGPAALAAPPSTEKAMSRRAEAQDLVDQISDGENVQASVNRLHFLGEEGYASAELGDILRKSVDPRQRQWLVLGLSLLAHPSAEPLLLSITRESDASLRMTAVQGLGRMKTKAAVQLKPLLADKTMGVRKEAARAIGAAGNAKLGEVLLDAARSEGEPEVRAAMLIAVGQSGDKKQMKGLEAFLDSSSESARFGAAQGLCLLGSPKGFAFAKKLLSSKDKFERRQGLMLFEGARAKDVTSFLKPLLKDQDKAIAAGAGRILYQGGEGAMMEWLVLSSHTAKDDDKLLFERELETLRLPDDQRKAILAKAGIK
jgi:HEAT repeat protein